LIVRLRSIGPLAEALGGARVERVVSDGAAVGDLLDRLARERPAAAPFLGVPPDRPVVAFRDACRLGEGDRLRDGDEVHLVVVVAGG
jgi:molybdopterin converting factor small subunit